MNERLRELMLEAGYATPELAGRGLLLADLIVQECAKCCDDYSSKILKYSQFGSNAARDCSDIIKQHFGINHE